MLLSCSDTAAAAAAAAYKTNNKHSLLLQHYIHLRYVKISVHTSMKYSIYQITYIALQINKYFPLFCVAEVIYSNINVHNYLPHQIIPVSS